MSISAMNWALSQPDLNPTTLLTLVALADCHNGHTGRCLPAQKKLAEVVNVSRASINRTFGKLEAAELIVRSRVKG